VQTLKALVTSLQNAVQQGHLQIYFHDPGAQTLLSTMGWDGALEPGSGDFLFLVDSNVGFNKVDPNIARAIRYDVDLSEPAAPIATLTVTYTNTVQRDVECVHLPSFGAGVYRNLQEACYWDYWRIYAPARTGLVDYTTAPVPGAWLLSGEDWDGNVLHADGESGTEVFSGLLVLPTHTTETIELDYELPAAVLETAENGDLTYRLRIGKQAGLDMLNVQGSVLPPVGYAAVSCETGEPLALSDAGKWIWTEEINTWREICVILSR
jgi:hypothetical protein